LDSTTNAFIGPGTNVNYNFPMSATSFGPITNRGTLNINTAGFNSGMFLMNKPAGGDALYVNNGGVVNVTGDMGFCSNAVVSMAAGSIVTVSGNLIIGSNPTGGSSSATVSAFGNMTNFGGILTAATTALNPANASIGTSCRLVILGGTNNLGAYSAQRSPGGNSAPPALGTDGLVISNGLVNMTSISVGNNAHGIMYLIGGIVTNTGTCTIKNNTATRPARFVQAGGLFVTPDPNVVILQGTADTVYGVMGGTNIVGGFQFNATTVLFTNAATVYVGSAGITGSGTTITAILGAAGKFGATADWINAMPITLNGGTFDAQDANGTPHNIYSSGVLRGLGGFTKTGGGTMTLGAANTYSGVTYVKNGTLALDTGGSLTSSTVNVGSGATFDCSLVTGGYVLNAGQTLGGSGVVTGAVTVVASGIIDPGTNGIPATLNFSNSLTETGGALNHFDLSNNPLGTGNDVINIAGDLTVSGTNTIQASGTLPTGTNYTLIKYGGNFNGDITNFNLTLAVGYLTNDATAKAIILHTLTTARGPANIVWVGNPLTNNWDTSTTTNWLNAGALDTFLPNDSVTFNATGAANPLVNITNSVLPASVVVNAATDYVFTNSGPGSIDGNTGLLKTNSGTLTILTTNNYVGATTIAGGVVQVAYLPNSGVLNPGPLGASSGDSANLVIGNGTLTYTGNTTGTDRGATLTDSNSSINIANSATVLTDSGSFSGSGTLIKAGPGTLILSSANSYGATVVSNGTLQVNSTVSAIGTGPVNFVGGSLSLNVSSQQTYPNALNVATTGTVISGGGLNNVVQGAWSGSGTLNIDMTAGGTFTINNPMTTNFTGTIHLADTSTGTFRFNAGGNGSGAQQSTASAVASFDLGNGSVTMNNRNGGAAAFGIYDLGSLSGGSGTTLRGAANGGGAINASFYSIGAKNLDSTYAGTIANGTGGSGATTSIIKVGTGTFALTGSSSYTGSTVISNGVLALANGGSDGSIGSSANIVVNAGTVLDVIGRSDHTMPLSSGQVICGNGTIRGILDNSNGGTVSAGDGITGALGTLTVTNTINLAGSGVTWMKVVRGGSPSSDHLVSSTAGVINYGGTLVVTNVGAPLQPGDTFTLFPAGTRNNSFSSILPNYTTRDTSQLNTQGKITFTGFTHPAITNVDFSGLLTSSSITITAIGAPNGPVTVLTSTNLLLPVANWTTAATATFDGSGNQSISVPVDPTLPQSFYLLQGF
jgi:fibronectin-binding autotransporter adhesin